MMMKELKLTRRRKLLGAVVICVILITGSTMLWQMGQVAEAAILDPHPGLLGWWRFDEGSGTLAEDSSGYGNHGTVYGATSVDGKYGKALSFDGTDDYVNVGNGDSLTKLSGNLTICFWINCSSGAPRWEAAIGPEVNIKDSPWKLIIKEMSAFNLQFLLFQGNGTNYERVFAYYGNVTNQLTYVAITREDKAITFFKNGDFLNSGSFSLDPITTSANVYMRFMSHPCICDEVRIYNRALSANEIRENFEKGPDFSSRLLAKVPKGTTQFIATLSWQGIGSINATIESPSETYTEDMVPLYQKTVYSSSSGGMLNIKRLAVSVTALSNDENWYIILDFDDIEDYKITVEVQT